MNQDQRPAGQQIAHQVAILGRRLFEDATLKLGRLGLTVPQAMLLRELDQPMAMNQVADRLHCDASNVTGIVDRLERSGLVERRARTGDRRVKELVITAEGRRIRRQTDKVFSETPGIAQLSAEEQHLLLRLLGRALEPFGDQSA